MRRLLRTPGAATTAEGEAEGGRRKRRSGAPKQAEDISPVSPLTSPSPRTLRRRPRGPYISPISPCISRDLPCISQAEDPAEMAKKGYIERTQPEKAAAEAALAAEKQVQIALRAAENAKAQCRYEMILLIWIQDFSFSI